MLSLTTACFILGSMFAAVGSVAVVMRFFQNRRPPTSRFRTFGPYPAGTALMILGTAFLLIGATSATAEDPPAVLLFAGGLAVGACVATPGLLLLASTWPSVPRWGAERPRSVNPPWRPLLAGVWMILALFNGGIVAPLVTLLMRQA